MKSEKKIFDVIVLYSKYGAKSAMDKNYKEKSPFSYQGRYGEYNDSYKYFLLKCKKIGIKAAFVSSDDIIGPGLFRSFWTYQKKWIRNDRRAYSDVIFDKFTPSTVKQNKELDLLTSSKVIRTFNDKNIKDIFRDKLNTYNNFAEWAIPTVGISNPTKKKVAMAKNKLDLMLDKHKNRSDFGDDYVLKDKNGAGGYRIYKVDFDRFSYKEISRQYEIDKKGKSDFSYVLQSFIDCDRGFVIGKYSGLIDLRVIILNGKIIQTYIRIAKEGNFLCNEHQGGNLVYMPINTIPDDVLVMTEKIISKLKLKLKISHCLYALDFIRSNNGNLYFIEGNSNPGIDWDHHKKINEIKSKELIDRIVEELACIVADK